MEKDGAKDKDGGAKKCDDPTHMDETECSNESGAAPEDEFLRVFELFARFGDRENDGGSISLKNIDKWLKQAKFLGSKITNADTAIAFTKVAKANKRVTLEEFAEFLNDLATNKQMQTEEIIQQLTAVGEPGLVGVTTAVSGGAVGANMERLTDTSQYTGTHRERFDEEGRGRGIEGREDRSNSEGYVSGYKGKDTYDSKEKQ